MKTSTFAKIFGWAQSLGTASIILAQNGFSIGHFHGTDFVSLIASVAVALGIHHASNTNGQN